MRPLPATGFAALGAGLIAVSYGLARFAFGLFVPPIRDELGLSPEVIGVIGSLAFVSFSLASVFAAPAADRLGARHAAMVAGCFALVGLSLISQASNAVVLGTGVFACGICTGMMMPALSAGVQAAVRPGLHGRVNAVMNAGTSAGVAMSVPAVLFLAGTWRGAYVSFALLAAVAIVAAWLFIPAASRADHRGARPPAPITREQWLRLTRLSLFAFAMGMVSSTYWVFAPDLIVARGGLAPALTGWLWLALGIAGLAGAAAGDMIDRHGAAMTQALALVALAAALALLAAAPGRLSLALVSAAVFGAAYMTLTGVYLVSGIRLLPGRPAMGPVLPFLAIAIGQAVGSPLAGLAVSRLGHIDAFAGVAALGLLVASCSPLFPERVRAASAATAPPA